MELFRNKFFIKTSLSTIQKICLAGLFIAIDVILQKVVAVNYIPAIPFVRISIGGPAIIIISSIILGPFYGLLVGTLGDVLGYFIFDPKSLGFFPQITAIYLVLGFLSYFIFCAIKHFKSKKSSLIILISLMALLIVAVSLVLGLNSSITLFSTTYVLEQWQKILIPSLMGVLLVLLVIFIIFFDKHFSKKTYYSSLPFNVYQTASACLIIEVFVMIIFGSLMKACAFSFKTYPIILISQIIVGFVNVPLNTILISYIIFLTKRYFQNV